MPTGVDLAVKIYLSTDNPEVLQMGIHEYSILRRLNHSQIVTAYTIFDAGTDPQQRTFLIMREIKGKALDDVDLPLSGERARILIR